MALFSLQEWKIQEQLSIFYYPNPLEKSKLTVLVFFLSPTAHEK